MNVVILSGSPRGHSSSRILAEIFRDTAMEQGHKVALFDVGHSALHPCIGCDHCRRQKGCVFHDDFTKIEPCLLQAQVVVLATPLYYFGFSAQLKTALDRMYAVNAALRGSRKLLLICTGADREEWAMEAIHLHASTLARYMDWSFAEALLALGVSKPDDLTEYHKEAARRLALRLEKNEKTDTLSQSS